MCRIESSLPSSLPASWSEILSFEDPLAVEDSNLPSTVTPLLTGSSSPDQPPDSAPLIDEDTTQEAGASSGEALSGPKQEQTAEVADITSLSTQVEDVREPMPEFLLMPTSTVPRLFFRRPVPFWSAGPRMHWDPPREAQPPLRNQ